MDEHQKVISSEKSCKGGNVKTRTITDVALDLRKNIINPKTGKSHTQQSWADHMGWAITTAVRFENGAQPSARMLGQMLEEAHANGLDDLAAEIQIHLNVALGPNFPVAPDAEMERFFVLLARRIFQNKKRHAAFLNFAGREIKILKAENAIRKEHQEQLNAALDAANERAQKETK
jgi:hypothetical protein